MTALTLPGTIPGLLRRGSPLVVTKEIPNKGNPCTPFEIGEIGLVSRTSAPLPLLFASSWNHDLFVRWPSSSVGLDLTDATGRAHACWWLAGASGLTGRFRYEAQGASWYGELGAWGLSVWPAVKIFRAIPGLLTIDPNDPRLLPDGSRWVDAEALRLVCLHFAEVPE